MPFRIKRNRYAACLKTCVDLVLMARLQCERADRCALYLVVFIELGGNGCGGVRGFPSPFSDGDELEGNAFFPAQARAFAADKEFIADPDVGGGDKACETVRGERGFVSRSIDRKF